jgi:hypothetical protein
MLHYAPQVLFGVDAVHREVNSWYGVLKGTGVQE